MSWQCYGDGDDDKKMTFVAQPSDAHRALRSLTYVSAYSNVEDVVTVTVYDGDGNDCFDEVMSVRCSRRRGTGARPRTRDAAWHVRSDRAASRDSEERNGPARRRRGRILDGLAARRVLRRDGDVPRDGACGERRPAAGGPFLPRVLRGRRRALLTRRARAHTHTHCHLFVIPTPSASRAARTVVLRHRRPTSHAPHTHWIISSSSRLSQVGESSNGHITVVALSGGRVCGLRRRGGRRRRTAVAGARGACGRAIAHTRSARPRAAVTCSGLGCEGAPLLSSKGRAAPPAPFPPIK